MKSYRKRSGNQCPFIRHKCIKRVITLERKGAEEEKWKHRADKVVEDGEVYGNNENEQYCSLDLRAEPRDRSGEKKYYSVGEGMRKDKPCGSYGVLKVIARYFFVDRRRLLSFFGFFV